MPKRNILIHISVLAFLFVFTLVIFRPYFNPGFPAGYDTLGHIAKAEQTRQMLDQYGTCIDWTDDWYSGYHPYHFYPPLSYYTIAFINSIAGDPALGMKIFTVLCFFIAAFSAYFFALKLLGKSRHGLCLPALACSIAYAFNPFIINFTIVRGEMPALLAISLMPFTFIALLKLLKNPRKINMLFYAISLSLVFLSHAKFGFIAGLGGMVYTIAFLFVYWLKGENSSPRPSALEVLSKFGYVVAALVLFLLLTAFWSIPTSTEANIANLGLGRWQIPYFSVNLGSIVNRVDLWLTGEKFGYLGISILLLSIPCFVSRKNRTKALGLLVLFAASILVALGVNTPVFEGIPLMNYVFPDRVLAISALSLAGMVCLSLSFLQSAVERGPPNTWGNSIGRIKFSSRQIIGIFVALLLIGGIMIDYLPALSSPRVRTEANEFYSLCDWLKQQPSENRGKVAFIGSATTAYAYSPILTEKPIMTGYYTLGSAISWDVGYASAGAIDNKDNAFFLRQFTKSNVEYVVVDKSSAKWASRLETLKETENFQELENTTHYAVLKYTGPRGFIQPLGQRILVIGKDANYKTNLLSEILQGYLKGLVFRAGDSWYVDDYEVGDLSEYVGIVLWGFNYHNKSEAEKLLGEYVAKGGNIIICMDGGPQEEFLGIWPHQMEFRGSINVTHSISPLNSPLTPIYEGGPWVAVHYEGLDENWLTINEVYTITGIKKIENKNVLFIGYNLLFHAAYHQNEAEKAFIADLLFRLIPAEEQRVEYEIVSFEPYEKIIDVNTSAAGDIFISHAYSPHWIALVDGKESEITNYQGFISIRVENGSHRIVLTYVETSTHYLADFISISAFIGVILLFLFGEKLRMKIPSSRPSLSTLDKIPPLTE